jgi:hypothetical protein
MTAFCDAVMKKLTVRARGDKIWAEISMSVSRVGFWRQQSGRGLFP